MEKEQWGSSPEPSQPTMLKSAGKGANQNYLRHPINGLSLNDKILTLNPNFVGLMTEPELVEARVWNNIITIHPTAMVIAQQIASECCAMSLGSPFSEENK
jgi:hypothetical protein